MDTIVVVVAAALAAIAGAAVGFVAHGYWASQTVRTAQDKAARIVAEARTQQKELILEAKDEKLRLQREVEDEATAKRAELQGLERRLLGAGRAARPAGRHAGGQATARSSTASGTWRRSARSSRALSQEQIAALERVAQLSAEDAKAVLLEAVRDEAEHDAVEARPRRSSAGPARRRRTRRARSS